MFLNHLVNIQIPPLAPNFVKALNLLFYCSHLFSLGRKWCRTSCNSFLPHCCLNQVFIAQCTTKMRWQNLEFPELSVKIAFSFSPKLVAPISGGSWMRSSNLFGCKTIYKELLIPLKNRWNPNPLRGLCINSEQLINVFLQGNKMSCSEPRKRQWCLGFGRDEVPAAGIEFVGDLRCWNPTKLQWIMHQIKCTPVRGSGRNFKGFG